MKRHLLIALKTAIAALTALRISMWLGLSHPYWSVFTVFILMTPFFGASLEKGLMRLAGTVAGCAAGIGIAIVSTGNPVAMAICVLLCAFSVSYAGNGRISYAVMLCGLTAMMVALPSTVRPDELFEIAWSRTAEIAIGIVVALLFDLIFRTRTAAGEFESVLKKMISDAAALSTLFSESRISGAPGGISGGLESIRGKMFAEFPRLRSLLYYAAFDSRRVMARRGAYARAIENLENIFIAITGLEMGKAFPGSSWLGTDFREEMAAAARDLKKAFELIVAGDFDRAPLDSSRASLKRVEGGYERLRAEGGFLGHGTTEMMRASAFFEAFQEVVEELDRLRGNLEWAGRGGAGRPDAPSGKGSASAGEGFDGVRFRHSLKAAAAALAAVGTWVWWSKPAGMSAVMTVMILMLTSPVQVGRRSLLRLAGCALGGAVALGIHGLRMDSPDSWAAFALCYLPAFLLFGYIQSGSAKYSYVGMQAALALALIMGPREPGGAAIAPVVERLEGIFVGVGIVMLVHRLMWPIVPEREFRKRIAGFWRDCGAWFREMRPGGDQKECPPGGMGGPEARAKDGPRECLEWVEEIGGGPFKSEIRAAALELVGCLQSTVFRLQALGRALANGEGADLRARIDSRLGDLDSALDLAFEHLAVSSSFAETGRRPPDLATPSEALEAGVIEVRRDGIPPGKSLREVTAFFSVTARYRELAAGLSEAVGLTRGFASPGHAGATGKIVKN